MDYDYLIGPTRTGYNAYVPDFPPAAVVAAGSTREDTVMRITRSMETVIDFLHSEGISVPPPRAYVGEIPPGFKLVSAQHKATPTPVGG